MESHRHAGVEVSPVLDLPLGRKVYGLGVATDDLGERHLDRREDPPAVVFRDDVRRLVADAGAQLIEVLPRAEYEWRHLAGAVHIPLAELGERAGELDRSRPVIPYCNDFQ